jgi:lipopolysaccharide transport system ATP-binding protein
MSDVAVRVEGLGKKYRLGQSAGPRYHTLRDGIARLARNPLGWLRGGPPGEEFWALKDVSFEVKRGEVVGIIGRNGAGKSTLLKILSRITEPTEGGADIYGRVGSLLEVGTGFNPELTGRENVFLNGAILGMRRAEVRRKFDEIVAFAEVEKFIDTPVKHYSSGMYMRLAFAVAAHLEPEILVVDEVLAVGDAEFQKKCLGKMGDVAKGGRTVLFVSHQLATITNLCTSCILLRSGVISGVGPSASIVSQYLSDKQVSNTQHRINRPSWAEPLISSVQVVDEQGKPREEVGLGEAITFEVVVTIPPHRSIAKPVLGVVVSHPLYGVVGGVNSRMTDHRFPPVSGEQAAYRCTLDCPTLLQGLYSVDLWFGDGSLDLDVANGIAGFQVIGTDIYGTGREPFRDMGVMFFRPRWEYAPQALT